MEREEEWEEFGGGGRGSAYRARNHEIFDFLHEEETTAASPATMPATSPFGAVTPSCELQHGSIEHKIESFLAFPSATPASAPVMDAVHHPSVAQQHPEVSVEKSVQGVDNLVTLIRPRKMQDEQDMDVLQASAELESPKTKSNSRAKRNPIHFVIFRNTHVTVQFCGNFQATMVEDHKLILSLKLGFQQKVFIHHHFAGQSNVVMHIRVVQSGNESLVALERKFELNLSTALISFTIDDQESLRDKPFDIVLEKAACDHNNQSPQILGRIERVMLHGQYAFNTLKRRAVHVDHDERDLQKKTKIELD